jgi:hypothetical protein
MRVGQDRGYHIAAADVFACAGTIAQVHAIIARADLILVALERFGWLPPQSALHRRSSAHSYSRHHECRTLGIRQHPLLAEVSVRREACQASARSSEQRAAVASQGCPDLFAKQTLDNLSTAPAGAL